MIRIVSNENIFGTRSTAVIRLFSSSEIIIGTLEKTYELIDPEIERIV